MDARKWESRLDILPHTALHNIMGHLSAEDGVTFGRAYARFEPQEYTIKIDKKTDEKNYDTTKTRVLNSLDSWMQQRWGYNKKVIIRMCDIYQIEPYQNISIQKEVLDLVIKYWPKITCLDICITDDQDREILVNITKLYYLKYLTIYNIENFPDISNLIYLKELIIVKTAYAPTLLSISKLPQLKKVHLFNIYFDEEDEIQNKVAELILSLLLNPIIESISIDLFHNAIQLEPNQTQDIVDALETKTRGHCELKTRDIFPAIGVNHEKWLINKW